MNNEIDKLNKMRQNGVISDDEYLVLLSQKQTEQRRNQNKPTLTPEQKKKHILYAIVFLGLFCILTGLGLMIAANWEMIPAFVKIAGGLVTLSGALIGAAYAGSRNNRLITEACLFVAFCLVGGNIALVQQVYHLQLSFAEGSLLWWVLTLPLLPFTRLRIFNCVEPSFYQNGRRSGPLLALYIPVCGIPYFVAVLDGVARYDDHRIKVGCFRYGLAVGRWFVLCLFGKSKGICTEIGCT